MIKLTHSLPDLSKNILDNPFFKCLGQNWLNRSSTIKDSYLGFEVTTSAQYGGIYQHLQLTEGKNYTATYLVKHVGGSTRIGSHGGKPNYIQIDNDKPSMGINYIDVPSDDKYHLITYNFTATNDNRFQIQPGRSLKEESRFAINYAFVVEGDTGLVLYNDKEFYYAGSHILLDNPRGTPDNLLILEGMSSGSDGVIVNKTSGNLYPYDTSWDTTSGRGDGPLKFELTSNIANEPYLLMADLKYNENDTTVAPRLTLVIEYTDGTKDTKMDKSIIKDGRWRKHAVSIAPKSNKTIRKVYGWVMDYSSKGTKRNIQADNIWFGTINPSSLWTNNYLSLSSKNECVILGPAYMRRGGFEVAFTKRRSYTNTSETIIRCYNSDSYYDALSIDASGYLVGKLAADDDGLTSSYKVENGETIHVVVQADYFNHTIYVNGNKVAERSLFMSVDPDLYFTNLVISSESNPFTGDIYYVALRKDSLYKSEIAAMYEAWNSDGIISPIYLIRVYDFVNGKGAIGTAAHNLSLYYDEDGFKELSESVNYHYIKPYVDNEIFIPAETVYADIPICSFYEINTRYYDDCIDNVSMSGVMRTGAFYDKVPTESVSTAINRDIVTMINKGIDITMQDNFADMHVELPPDITNISSAETANITDKSIPIDSVIIRSSQKVTISDKITDNGSIHSKMNDTLRDIKGRVDIVYTNPFIDGDTEVIATEVGRGTYPESIVDGVTSARYKYFSLHDNVLDGTYHPLPDKYDIKDTPGLWGTSLSDSSGTLPEPAVITINMSPRPMSRIELAGDEKLNCYPVDFNVYLIRGDDIVYQQNIRNNSSAHYVSSIATVQNVTAIKIEIFKINKPNSVLKITESYTDLKEEYYNEDIIDIYLLEELEDITSPSGGALISNEIDITLDNSSGKFSFMGEKSPVRPFMKRNRKIKAWLGVDLQTVNELPRPKFSRESEAYINEQLMAKANEPRYVVTAFGKGLLIEQYTLNLIDNPIIDSNASGWSAGINNVFQSNVKMEAKNDCTVILVDKLHNSYKAIAPDVLRDMSGNGNDVYLVNFNYNRNSGWYKGMIKFDGINDYLRIPNLDLDSEHFTIQVDDKLLSFDGDKVYNENGDNIAYTWEQFRDMTWEEVMNYA